MALKLDHHWNDPRNQFMGPPDPAEQLSFSGGAEPYCDSGPQEELFTKIRRQLHQPRAVFADSGCEEWKREKRSKFKRVGEGIVEVVR